jgi:Ni/Co efflux regulator RcnB
MRTCLIAGLLSGAAVLAAAPAMAQRPAPPPVTGARIDGGPVTGPANAARWGQRIDGRWAAGHEAPGGWSAYRTPVNGFILPGYWLQSGYLVRDPAFYGLPAPPPGHGWSRYYDDAVLTDQYGKVHDSRIAFDWDSARPHHEAMDDRRPAQRDDSARTLGGVLAGGVTGGLLGGAMGGTGGAIIGAGLGAIAGGALVEATDHDDPGHDGRARARHEDRLAREEARQRTKLDRMSRRAGYRDYADYRHSRSGHMQGTHPGPGGSQAGAPHWAMRGGPEGARLVRHGPGGARIEQVTEPGYIAGGYYYPGATVTTITFPPGTTVLPRHGAQPAPEAEGRTATVRYRVVRTD